MKQLMELALETARRAGAEYCDIRYIRSESQRIVTRNGHLQSISEEDDSGFGVRVLKDGAWGFASSGTATTDEIVRIAREAVSIAKASARSLGTRPPVTLSQAEAVQDQWSADPKIDPFDMKVEEKIDVLFTAEDLMRKSAPVSLTHGSLNFYKEDKHFMSSEGSDIRQTLTQSGGVIGAMARDQNEAQMRSYPAQFGGDYALKGWEHIEELDFSGNAPRIAKEACDMLRAPQCPSGYYDLILEGSQLALQIHESCGHPIELDRVLGMEAGMVGTSFLTTEKKGTFRYGSPSVNIVADATVPGGNGSFGYDDDGVPAQAFDIVKEGIFEEYLTSRETASAVGSVSNGANRAVSWNRIPLVRMTNINLTPGDFTLDEIIKDTKRGIYMDLNRSYSIDDRRYNFQFGTEVGWEIEDGSITRMVKNPTYTGNTPEFWNSCDAVASKDEWKVWGIPNCGKGEPGQPIRVGHGASPARFRNVRVGVGKW
ncbi:MAG: TldD/PmbA family protein [Bacillota bacterium]